MQFTIPIGASSKERRLSKSSRLFCRSMLPRILFTSSVAGRIEVVRNMVAIATIMPSTKEEVASRLSLRWDSAEIIKSTEAASMGTRGREAMTTSSKRDHATPIMTTVSTEEARATIKRHNTHRE